MNKSKFYVTALFCMIFMIFIESCQKDLLYPNPESLLTSSNAFSSSKDIDLSVLGIYNSLQSRVPTDYQIMEAPTDNLWIQTDVGSEGTVSISTLDDNPDNLKLNTFWKSTYSGIFRCNTVLANIDIPTDYSNTQKAQFTGEAKFMRAMFYFDLVRIFGGVPAITNILSPNESRKIPMSTETEIYSLIVKDLLDAVNMLPPPSSMAWGRASKGAAVALLAKVYVYLKDWDNAKKYLDELFSSEFNYSLVPDYANLFKIETEVNSEAIFSVAYVEGTNGQGLAWLLAPNGGVYKKFPFGNFAGMPTWDLRKSYKTGDSRFSTTITEDWYPFTYKPGDPAIWYPYFSKWTVPASVSTSSGLDIVVLRLADMILLNSEVLYNLGHPDEALTQINRIRERAFGNSSHNYAIVDIATPDEFMDKLLLERRLELAVENNRWFDLVRTGRFTSVLQNIEGEYSSTTGTGIVIKQIHAKPYMKYFPIPNEQIQVAAPGVLKQNEGY